MSYYDDLLAVIASYGEPPVAGGKFIFSTKGYFSFYLTSSGDLYAAGSNGDYQLGNGTNTNVKTWTLVASGVASVACGDSHSLYISTSGALYGCGYNVNYQLGNGTNTNVQTWTQLVA